MAYGVVITIFIDARHTLKEAWRGKKLSHNAKMWRNVELYHSVCRYIRLSFAQLSVMVAL